MSTRVIVDGRVVQYGPTRPVPVVRVVREYADATVAERTAARSLDPSELEVGKPARDQHGALYRTVGVMRAGDGWASAETVLGWFPGLTFEQLSLWVQLGMVDGAVLAGTTAKRYRVRDTARCRAWMAKHAARVAKVAERKALRTQQRRTR